MITEAREMKPQIDPRDEEIIYSLMPAEDFLKICN